MPLFCSEDYYYLSLKNISLEIQLSFQHKLLTAIHKHYPIEEWQKFAKENPTVLPVSSKTFDNFIISS